MKTWILKKLALTAALCAGALGFNTAHAAIGSFTASYTNNFDSIGTAGTTLPVGFTSMVIAGANTTYSAANPINPTGIASATADTQTLTIWNAGSAVASSGTTTFNVGCWDTLNDRAMGTDPTSTAANLIQLAMTNNTGGTLAGVTFWYDCKCLTNGTSGDGTEKAELPGYCFFYSTAGATNAAASWIEVGVAGNVVGATNSSGVPIPNGLCLPNFTKGTTMSSGPVTITFATPLTNNGVMYFRWADDNCQTISPDQMLAIDNVGIAAIPAAGPYASITSPANSASFIPGSNVVITASAGDYTSTVTNVEFFAGSTDLGGVTTTPYTLTNSSLALGSYALTAVAKDVAGLSITSAVVNITVAYVPPTVSITTPANAANFTPGSSVPITATATDLDTTVTNVEFFVGSTDLGGVATAPYSVTWPTVPAGSYALTAVAKDALGLSSTSAVVNITLSYLPPTVSLTSPATGSKFTAPATIALAATATDSTATVTNVAFYAQGTNLLGNATTAPYTLNWSNVAANSYSLTARAMDNQGLSTTSAVVSVTVTNPTIIPFTGSYAQNFDWDLSNGATFMPAGFTCLLLPGTTNTYSQTNPISSTAMVLATNSSSQTLVVWNTNSARAASATSLFNAGTPGNNYDRCLGTAPTNTAGDVIQLAMTNNSGTSLAGLIFSYDCKCLTNGTVGTEQSELPGYCFFYSTTGTTPANSWIEVGAAGNVPGATNSGGVPIANGLCLPNFTQGTTMSSGPVTITFVTPLTNGGVMYFRWCDDKSQANKQDQMLGIDNISISGISAAGPLASITSPANNANFIPGSNVGITANATETGGSITNVEFFANGTDLGGTATAPYGLTWTNPAAGSYALTVIASDTLGVTATSAVVNITVSYVLPTVSLTSPTNGVNYVPNTGTPIVLTANATDNSGTNITSVAFYANSSLIYSVSSAPYTFTIPASYVGTTVPVGSYALTAVATDALGLVSTSSVVNITIAYVPPTVSLTSPASGATFISPATIPLAATAAGTGTTVTNVAFYQGSKLLANVSTAPYAYNWANVPAGSYTLTAQATDNNGATATSSAVSITVTNPLVASFTGNYTENFDLDLTNSTTTMPAGFQALGLAGDHFTFTNGIPITSNAIAAATAGASSLTVWNAGAAVTKAGSTLFNIGCWDSLSDRALGTDPTGNGGTVIQLALKNNTGNPLNGVVLSYTERCLTNGSTSNGSYTDDGTERLELPGYSFFYSLTGDTQPTNWFRVDALAQTNWVQGTSSDSGPVTITFPTPLPANGVMYFRWADDNTVASSPDQMFAIDNISVGLSQNLFQTAFDSGPGFFSGENLYCTNVSGSSYNVWSTTNISLSVTNWTLEGPTVEFPIANTPNSRYGITVTPTQSPTYYIFASTNNGPYATTEPLASLTTSDYSTFNFTGANVPITSDGIFLIEGVNLYPTAQLTAPSSGDNYLPGTNLTLSAMASELNGLITNVEFFANSIDLGGTTNSPYSLIWSNISAGNYSLTVVASDTAGITATSAVVNISVSIPNVPPTVSLTRPANNAAFNAPASISLSATATDSDGTVTNIAFYQGATLIGNVATASNQVTANFTWTNVSAGIYSVTAVAKDNSGTSTISTTANITVADLTALQKLQQIKTVFVIALENHNFNQIQGNAAAPYVNSLITAGHSNAVQVSYATKYYNAGIGVHPSEPSYIWAEAGTDFGWHSDADPGAGNTFSVPHLTAQLNTAGIPWKNYQEDVQYSSGPTHSAAGSGSVNAYNGSSTYDYAVKHNPMAFFSDTQNQNTYPLANLLTDLTNNAVGRYNWITPDQYNDMHSGLGSYAYHGSTFSGDQAAIAEGDNFLSIIIPKIMASPAYQSNGVIVLWWDETEGGDGTGYTIPEIIISPLAKGNAYAGTVEYNHSSDLKTMEEIFGLSFLSNSIPAGEYNASGSGYNNVATANDLGDLFQVPASLPALALQQPPGTGLANGVSSVGFGTVNLGTNLSKTFTIVNSGPGSLVVSNATISGANAGDFAVSGITLPATISGGASTTFVVAFTPATTGARSATLTITDNDTGNNPFIVVLTGTGNVVSNPPPTVTLTSPSNNATFAAPTTITLSATASASSGSVTNVGFYQGATLLANDTTAPYNYTWTGVAAGSYALTAVVQSDTGLSATSTVVNVTVTNAAAPGPWSFGIISDTQWTVSDDGKNPNSCAADIISQVNQELINKGAKFAIAIGDLCDNGSTAGEDARAAYAQSLYNAGIAFFPLRGNHDSATTEFQRIYPQTGGGLQNNTPSDVFAAGNDSLRSPPAKTGSAFSFGLNFSTPSGASGYSYSFDYNNARIILLDQFISTIDSQQSWITAQLSGKGANNHGFVFGHKGLITESHADNLFGSSPAADPAGTDAFISSLATNKVHYYVGGHDHMHDYTVVTTTDGVTARISELVCASDSSKFYTPTATANDVTYDVPAFGHARQTPVAQDLYEIGYYFVTVDGPRVTVNYYAVPSGSSGADISTTPPLTGHWVLKHTFGYSLNGQEFMVPQGQQYTNVQDAIAVGGGFTGTHMAVLNGTNRSTMKDASNRALVKQIDTGWSPATGNLVSDVLTLWGMKNLGSSTSDTYALSVSYNPAAGTPQFLASKDANGNWTNAVTLNSGGTSQFVSGPYSPGAALGTYGIDTNTMTVWAVINHDGDFAAIVSTNNTPPVITVPNDLIVEAAGPTGSVLNFTVTATDAQDGPVTPMSVPASGSTFPLGTNTVIVTASDSGGLSATNTFQIIVRDTTPPVIMMLGANPYTNFQGVAFADPGATAYDIVAGSVPVTTNSNVNVNTLGTYTVQYAAGDAAGNYATNARTVQVVAIPVPANLNGAAVSGGGNRGAFQLSFTGAIGQPYRILGSTDLIQWSVLTSGTVTTNPVTFTDIGAATNTAGYYRIVSP